MTSTRSIRKGSTLLASLFAISVCAALVATTAPSTAEAERGKRSAQQAAPAGVVNINTATAEELERLPGVGPSRATAIVALRDRRGKFQKVQELMRVRGIGRATLRRLAPMLALEGQTTLAARPKRASPKPKR